MGRSGRALRRASQEGTRRPGDRSDPEPEWTDKEGEERYATEIIATRVEFVARPRRKRHEGWLRAAILGLLLGCRAGAGPSSGEAYAQAGLDEIEQKVQDVSDLVSKVLVVVVVIGAMFVGFRFIQGDPNTWKYAMMFVLGRRSSSARRR